MYAYLRAKKYLKMSKKSLRTKKDIFILTGGAKAAENAWKMQAEGFEVS